MESYYCRANTTKFCLEPIWLTQQTLCTFCCEDFCVTTPISKPVVVMSLKNKNISLFTPKKDDTGNLALKKKEVHDQMKYEVRLEKK